MRDVVQNHLLQVVALLTMEAPFCADPEALRDERARLQGHALADPASVVRGQFRGYREGARRLPDSKVETFAAVRLFIDSWRWDGVPFYIRAGKCLPTTATEVCVELTARPAPSSRRPLHPSPNYVRFRLGPDVRISIGARAKKPGEAMAGKRRGAGREPAPWRGR